MLTHSDHVVSLAREHVAQIQTDAERERLATEAAHGTAGHREADVDEAPAPSAAPAARPRRLALLRLF